MFLLALLPINPAVFLNSPDLASLAFMPNAPATVPGVGSDIKQPGITELAYPVVPVPAIRHLYALMGRYPRAAAQSDLPDDGFWLPRRSRCHARERPIHC